jgi:hypothetical protein
VPKGGNFLKIKKALVVVPLSLSLLAPVSAFAQTPTSNDTAQVQKDNTKSDQEKLAKSKAMDSKEELKKLKEMGLEGKSIKLDKGDPLVINFDDGSRIEYSYEVTPTPVERLPVAEQSLATKSLAIDSLTTTAMRYLTAHVKKQYFYASANANTGLYTDYKIDSGEYMWVRTNYPFFQGTFMKSDWQKTRTVDGTGSSVDMLTTELNGQFTATAPYAGDYYTRTYLYRMDIDHWGGAYLRVIY